MMIRAALAAVVVGNSALSPALAQGVPPGLYGNSIVVTWTENRMQRQAGSDAGFKSRSIAQSLGVYVSSQGRLFSRRNATNQKGATGKREGLGEEGRSSTGGLRSTQFQGGDLVVSAELAGGARQVTVSFTGDFSGCTAKVRVAREVGRQAMQVKSMISGKMIEVQSVDASVATCAIRKGNIFGDG